MRRKSGIISGCIFLVITAVMLGLGVFAAASSAAPESGLTFTADDIYTATDKLGGVPLTVSAWVNVPAGTKDSSIFMGTYVDDTQKGIEFGVTNKGYPYVKFITTNSAGAIKTPIVSFANDIRNGEWTHLTFTITPYINDKGDNIYRIICYINGEDVTGGTLGATTWTYTADQFARPLMLGGDYRTGNTSYFRGVVGEVAMFEPILTAEQVTALYSGGVSAVSVEPLAHYDLEGTEIGTDIADLSNSGNTLVYSGPNEVLDGGMTFTQDALYTMRKPFDAMPKTFEAVVKMPASATGKNCILGSYYSTAEPAINFEIRSGCPYMYYDGGSAAAARLSFSSAAVNTDKFVRITIVHDADNSEMHCYLNGVLTQTLDAASIAETMTSSGVESIIPEKAYAIGGDLRSGNAQAFSEGTIYKAAFWSDVRTADEVAAGTVDTEDEALIAAYDFTGSTLSLSDISGNGYDIGIDVSVSFNGNGAGGSMDTVSGYKAGDSYTLPACSYTAPDGMYFKGWAYTSSGDVITEEAITLTDSVELYAIFEDIVYPGEGMAFTTEPYYILEENLSEIPYTYFAEIYIPEGLQDASAGAILSSWANNTDPSVNFYIGANGKPGFTYRIASGSANNTYGYFSEASVPYGEWVRIAVTVNSDDKKTVTCCVNGVVDPVKVKLKNEYDENSVAFPLVLGGNAAPGNTAVFRGEMKQAALFKRTFTDEELQALCTNGITTGDTSLIGLYDLVNVQDGKDISDASGSGNDFIYINRWFSEKEPVSGYAYSFAVIGDTQSVTYKAPEELSTIYEWIVANKDAKKIKYAFGLGDIVETASGVDSEWSAAKDAISLMNGVLPYSLIRGNHDNSAKFNSYFAEAQYMDQFDGFYEEGKIDNFYDLFSVDGKDYLLIGLDYGPSDAVLEWAGSIIENYPEHSVIITTHAMLGNDGEWFTDAAEDGGLQGGGLNNGPNIWDKLVSKYENIELVLCGHDPCDDIVYRQAVGDMGNTVTVLLIDPQYVDKLWGVSGMVTMLYVYPETGKVEIECYSTVREQYFKESNQYSLAVFSTDTEVTYEAESVDLGVIAPEKAKEGDEITVQIVARTHSDEVQGLKALNFELIYDNTKLTFNGITAAEALSGEFVVTDQNKAVFAYADDASNGIDPAIVVKGTDTVVATATFTVGDGVLGDVSIALTDTDVTLVGDDTYNGYTPALTGGSDTVNVVRALDIDFILKDGSSEAVSYTILASGTKIAVIKSDVNDTAYTYGGKPFYYSEKLGGYAMTVADSVSVDEISAGVISEDKPSEEVIYDGDVTGDGNVTSGDAALVSRMLHGPDGGWSDLMRLSADVTDGTSYITTADALWILKESVGLN